MAQERATTNNFGTWPVRRAQVPSSAGGGTRPARRVCKHQATIVRCTKPRETRLREIKLRGIKLRGIKLRGTKLHVHCTKAH